MGMVELSLIVDKEEKFRLMGEYTKNPPRGENFIFDEKISWACKKESRWRRGYKEVSIPYACNMLVVMADAVFRKKPYEIRMRIKED